MAEITSTHTDPADSLVAQKDTPLSITPSEADLLCLFYACIGAYVFCYEDTEAGLMDALKGSLSLMLQPRYREAWEAIVNE